MLSHATIWTNKISPLHLLILLILAVASDGNDVLDDGATFMQMAVKYGHPAEKHWVITEDGYNITIFRIPGDQTRPVFLVHGYTANADCFLERGNISLAITLAEKSYDVWVVSLRGTKYSKGHISIDVENDPRRFYNFTFYEMGIYDISACIDHILRDTQQEKLTAIGYSVGTTVFYVLGSEKPEYNKKIKIMISLGPICFYTNVKGTTKLTIDMQLILRPNLSVVYGPPSTSGDTLGTSLVRVICRGGQLAYDICVKGFVFPNTGPDEAGFEPEFMTTFFGHIDVKVAKLDLHTLQVCKTDTFAKFDYGVEGNLELYNSTLPPEFDLGKVTMKVALLVGRGDYISTVADVQRLSELLPNVVHHEILPYDSFNHIDFAFAQHMPSTLYPSVLPLVVKYL